MEKVVHKVLALKYRPKNFNELIGQDIAVETIKNSIILKKLPNAYLLSGIRGVGKTTTARLIAQAINCKKNFIQGEKVIQAVQEAGVFYKEGFMYRCHPQIPALLDLIKNKVIGDVKKITSSFGFDMKKIIPEHRLFNKDLAGGAILDVGLYPVSFSRMIAGANSGKKFINPKNITGTAEIGKTGVDEVSSAIMEFDNGVTAEANTAIMKNMDNNAIIDGSDGKIIIDDPWMPGRNGGPYHSIIRIIKNEKEELREFKGPEHLFFFEAELSSQTILKEKQQVPYPGMTWEDTLGNLKVLDLWRQKINYQIKEDNL